MCDKRNNGNHAKNMATCPFHSKRNEPPSASSVDEFAFLSEACSLELKAQAYEQRRLEYENVVAQGLPAPFTSSELTWAGRIAWRNHARCIGRLPWSTLRVRDCRGVSQADEIFESLCEHLALATNGGNIRAVMTVFAPSCRDGTGPRIWNHQLCGYAGYRDASGCILGDPANVEFTRLAICLGWTKSDRSAFDLLPIIIEDGKGHPRLYELPAGSVLEIRLRHPRFAWFEELNLRWYAVPILTDMCFHAAATNFTAAPFNGWYMVTEIGARNLADQFRYNQLPIIAEKMNLDSKASSSLWKDYALVELNAAVLHSFWKEGVKMVDHHTASNEFMRFCEREKRAGRSVSARWDWIVPPMSPATTSVFHAPMTEVPMTPGFHYQIQN
jgi:nitric-oxide synthase